MSETVLRKTVQFKLSPKTILFRNNQGQAKFTDKYKKVHYVKYGVAPGGSDLLGWTSRVITPDMVGQRVAIFTAVETKSNVHVKEEEQEHFIEQVKAAGGLAGFALTIEDALEIVA